MLVNVVRKDKVFFSGEFRAVLKVELLRHRPVQRKGADHKFWVGQLGDEHWLRFRFKRRTSFCVLVELV